MKTLTMLLLGGGVLGAVVLATRKGGSSGSSGASGAPEGKPAGGATGDIFTGTKPWNATTGQGQALGGEADAQQKVKDAEAAAAKAKNLYEKGSAGYAAAEKCAQGDCSDLLKLTGSTSIDDLGRALAKL